VTTKEVARCSIYQDRPKLCQDYPTASHWVPRECTYSFIDGERFGDCSCDVGACCATPRENGQPGGAVIPEIAGGKPCQYLVQAQVEVEEPTKIASVINRNDLIKEALGL
jgi:hypothetical protein